MNFPVTLLWISIAIIFYTYVGYGFLVGIWAYLIKSDDKPKDLAFEPEVTLIVPAYNEAAILSTKVKNCLELDYPTDRIQLLFITDGSTDSSAEVLAAYPQVKHLHVPARGGKSLAENRAIQHVTTPYIILTDCNTLLNPEAVRVMLAHYRDPRVGAVSGEKHVLADGSASGSGEGLYWKYESFLKRCDSKIYSLMGAAGELVSFRTELFAPLEKDTILDDFVQSMRIVGAGYKVVYEPRAYAMEPPSSSLKEEMGRKVRICAGGWQSMARLTSLLNPFRQPVVSFLYISHRVLRWSLTPALLALVLPLNAYLAYNQKGIYIPLLVMQALFYVSSLIGWWLAATGRPAGPTLIPLYFTMMNVAAFRGFGRFLANSQPAAWDKANRSIPELAKASEFVAGKK
jgi:cellulose synthase/poly-beta-1,6-N-acetylglucosamine synthase-like glycosyltransferase